MLTTETHTKLIECSDAHCAADEFIAGHYDWHGGACAIGCAVRDCQKMGILDASLDPSDHAALASATGLPKMVLLLQDHVFEGLSDEERPHWPPRFWRAVKPGVDYSQLPARIMERLADRLAADAIEDDLRAVALSLAVLWRSRAAGDEPGASEWEAALSQAKAAWLQAKAAWLQAKAALSQAEAALSQARAAWLQARAAWLQAKAALSQAEAALSQAKAAWLQAEAALSQAEAALSQAKAALSQAKAAWLQAEAALSQAEAALCEYWRFVAAVTCEELSA